ncbi:MAG TPA: hypothetical protein VIB48_16045, partial [Acidimicrobiia bacterium]
VVAVFGGAGALVYYRRRLHRTHPDGIECSLRVVEGSIPGLSTRWRGGFARFHDGTMTWTRWWVPARPVEIQVEPFASTERAVHGAEAWIVSRNCVVRTYSTGRARIEIALLPERTAVLDRGLAG